MNAQGIKDELKRLIDRTTSIEPGLASRLEEIRLLIKDQKASLLFDRNYLLLFLLEVIADAKLSLDLKALSSEQRQKVLAGMTPSQRYWHDVLFPKWFNEPEPRLKSWHKKIIYGYLRRDEEPLLNILLDRITRSGGTAMRRSLMDVAMVTDLIVSGHTGIPLCVRLSTLQGELLIDKMDSWVMISHYWGIERSRFVRFHPEREFNIIEELADDIFRQSDELPRSCYIEDSMPPEDEYGD